MRVVCVALLFFGSFAADSAVAQKRRTTQRRTTQRRTVRYPRVYGNTGRPYGPSQAHYQYQRQYGRAWHGYGGVTTTRRSTRHTHIIPSHSPLRVYGPVIANYYGTGAYYHYPAYGILGAPGYYGYAPAYGYGPAVTPEFPNGFAPGMTHNAVMQRSLLENELRWNRPIILSPVRSRTLRRPNRSSTAAVLKSLRAQFEGEAHFHRQEYHKAYERYRMAVRSAPDRAEANFRLGYVLTALGHYSSAVAYFKRGLRQDTKWPRNGVSLGRIFGRQNEVAKLGVVGDVTRWVKKDIRDPDRLFLLGVLLYFDNHPQKSALLFATAYRLKGTGDHLKLFLLAGTKAKSAPNGIAPGKPTSKPPQPKVDNNTAPPAPIPISPKPVKKKNLRGPVLPPLPKP